MEWIVLFLVIGAIAAFPLILLLTILSEIDEFVRKSIKSIKFLKFKSDSILNLVRDTIIESVLAGICR